LKKRTKLHDFLVGLGFGVPPPPPPPLFVFINISVISWREVLWQERKLEYPEEITDLSQVTDKLDHMMFY
jgi:hypothetical protein